MNAIDDRIDLARTNTRLNSHVNECERRYAEMNRTSDERHRETQASINRIHERIDRGQLLLIGSLGTAIITLVVMILQLATGKH